MRKSNSYWRSLCGADQPARARAQGGWSVLPPERGSRVIAFAWPLYFCSKLRPTPRSVAHLRSISYTLSTAIRGDSSCSHRCVPLAGRTGGGHDLGPSSAAAAAAAAAKKGLASASFCASLRAARRDLRPLSLASIRAKLYVMVLHSFCARATSQRPLETGTQPGAACTQQLFSAACKPAWALLPSSLLPQPPATGGASRRKRNCSIHRRITRRTTTPLHDAGPHHRAPRAAQLVSRRVLVRLFGCAHSGTNQSSSPQRTHARRQQTPRPPLTRTRTHTRRQPR